MKHKQLYALTLTSAAMLCSGAAMAQDRTDPSQQSAASRSGAARNNPALGSVHATKLIGAMVKNKAGDSIGEITDLVVSPGASVTTAVVSVGGVLGIGDKKIGVPYKSFSVSPDGKTVYLDMTAEQLKNQPAYTETSDDKSAATSRAQSEPGTLHRDTTATAATASAHVLKASEQPASSLIGAEVVDRSASRVAKIKDVIVSTGGRGAQAVLSVGGGIGNIGGRMVSVPLDQLTIQRDAANPKHEPQRVQTALTVSDLEALPEFRYE
jgi:sporulation protein YlmC with PRC-barrel domain